MTGLARTAPWHHLAVGGAAAVVGVAGFTGVIGEHRPEHFDNKQVVVMPAGADGLRIVEVVDQDFGEQQRHGYQRIIPNDFGHPTDVTATATDAPADLHVDPAGYETRIRIGSPSVTVTGQHRYTLAYTLPDAQISSGSLALDIIGTDETLRTDHFEVVVTGFELADTTCNVGGYGDVGGCELIDDGSTYRVEFRPLEPGEGITIGGRIVGSREVVAVEAPPLPEAPPDRRVPIGLGTTVLGLATGAGTFAWARRRGRNEVAGAGGATDAAFGFSGLALPPPPPGATATGDLAPPSSGPGPGPGAGSGPGAAPAPSGVRLVTDDELLRLATTEFAPPAGVDPWLGRVLMREGLDDATVAAWMSGHAARDVLTVSQNAKDRVELAIGPRFASAAVEDQGVLRTMLGSDGHIELGKYSKAFATGWADIAKRQRSFVANSGFWKRPLSGASGLPGAGIAGVIVVALAVVGLFAQSALRASPLLGNPVVALLLAVVVPGVTALFAYRRLLPARTASGSALALRTESFRRFLAASEARHVEWAWQHGMLREYSAWAVALDTADAWESAMRGSTVPPAEMNVAPIILYHHASAIGSTRVAPSSSGRGGGGGFSGGFSGGSVGGGGGGGSSGSW